MMISNNEMHLPSTYWNLLSHDDKAEYIRLRTSFHHGEKLSTKDKRIATFRKELLVVLNYLERSKENMEARCVLTGICFAGPIICVNTRQLKAFLSRCKSSINGSFQQLGFVALRTKAKAKSCVVTVLPSLEEHQNILRQWTIRYASNDVQSCFVSSYPYSNLPEITEDDLFDEKKATKHNTQYLQYPIRQQQNDQIGLNQPLQFQSMIQTPPQSQILKNNNSNMRIFNHFHSNEPSLFKPKIIEFDLPSIEEFIPNETVVPPLFKTSFSMDFKDFENDEDEWENSPITDTFGSDNNTNNQNNVMTRSFSAQIKWSFFDDDLYEIA